MEGCALLKISPREVLVNSEPIPSNSGKTTQWNGYSIGRYLWHGYLECITEEKRHKPGTNLSSQAAHLASELSTQFYLLGFRDSERFAKKNMVGTKIWSDHVASASNNSSIPALRSATFLFLVNPRYGCLLFFTRRRLSSTQFSCPADPGTTLSHHKSHDPAAVDDYFCDNGKCGPVQDKHRLERPTRRFV